jgi:site-specific recombinase XerD
VIVLYFYHEEIQANIARLQNTYSISEKSMVFYRGRIKRFFNEYMGSPQNENRPLDAISYYDLNTYLIGLQNSDSEKVNIYQSLKRFFEFTYFNRVTLEIMSQVEKPNIPIRAIKILADDDYSKLHSFIVDKNGDIRERLILGLFLFTGLSRKFIANLLNSQIILQGGLYKLKIWDETTETILPLKAELQLAELQLIVQEYSALITDENILNRVVNINENNLSSYVSELIRRITNHRCTPTILSNTFITKALKDGNCVYEVGTLTLEHVTTIVKHIDPNKDFSGKQMSILNSF